MCIRDRICPLPVIFVNSNSPFKILLEVASLNVSRAANEELFVVTLVEKLPLSIFKLVTRVENEPLSVFKFVTRVEKLPLSVFMFVTLVEKLPLSVFKFVTLVDNEAESATILLGKLQISSIH